jgi:serine phosphatase RsbU (regulator of sigma subunit)
MDRRLTAIRSDLDDRLTQASNAGIDLSDTDPVIGNIMNAIGDAAPLVDALEFHPVAPPAAKAPERVRVEVAALATPAAKPGVPVPEPMEAPQPPEPAQPAPEPGEIRIHPPVAGARYTIVTPELREGIVIDLPRVPQFEIPPEEAAKLAEIGRLSRQLGTNADQLSPAEHEKLKNELRRLQREVDVKMDLHRGQFEREMAEFTRKQQTAMNAQIQRLHARARQKAAQDQLDGTLIGGGGAPAKITGAAAVATPPDAKPAAAAPAAKARPKPEIKLTKDLTPAEKLKLQTSARRTALILGRKLNVPVTKNGAVVGQITAQVRPEEVIRRVLGNPGDDGEIAFAIDREGNLYTRNPQERATLDRLGIPEKTRDIPGWIVAMTADEESGMRVGVARPVGENLQELRRTAARNFTWGLGLVFVAIIGVVPFTNHLTRDVQVISDGAERIAHGDLMTRLPVKSKNEIGQLAVAFNRMAEDLSLQQQRLVEQERARKEQEMQQRLLALEYDRKTVELEDARRFQLSMLPKELPKHPTLDVAVFTQTATEVGGDYYDFHVVDGGALSITIGDATGHGAKAGTMVTVVKTLFAGYSPDVAPSHFLRDAAEKIKRMELGRMSMALSLGRFDGHHLTVASAGMPPVLVRRAAGMVEEFSIGATPLGTLGADYRDQTLDVFPGDTVLFLTDGFPELLNAAGQQLGYAATQELFDEAAAGAQDAAGVIAKLDAAARQWHGDQPPNDDVTFVVVKVA